MKVPFLDLTAQNRPIVDELRTALDSVITESQFILGPAVARFEESFARYVGAKHCIGLNNGTSALHMALIASNVGPQDEVITTPHTWISTSWAISYVGATPVYVDIDPVTFNLDPNRVERAITPRTKAILPVHLYGQSADLAPLLDLAGRHNIPLIEDAAQAHGAQYEGRRVGSLGKSGCFSFYPGKNLGCFGEGGAVVTNDDDIAERIRSIRDHAQNGRHNHVELGFNTRMEGVQAAVLDVKLKYLDGWNSARTRHADHYRQLLANVPNIDLPVPARQGGHVWHLFVIRIPGKDREKFRAALAEKGIATGVHYPTPVPYQPAYANLGYHLGDFPEAERVMSTCVSLPMFAELTEEQIVYTCDAVRAIATSKLCE